MNSSLQQLSATLIEEATKSTQRVWLILFPASGKIQRRRGVLLFADVGGEAKWHPFLVDPSAQSATALDPRVMVYDDDTLRVAYHPREHLDKVNAMAGQWYAANPDVFATADNPILARL